MMPDEIRQVMRSIADSVKAKIQETREALNARIDAVEQRLSAIPSGPQGERGIDGAPGSAGPMGPAGERGERGEQGDTGERGETGPMGPQGERGPAGERGEKGIDGRDARDGRDGKDGRDGTPGRDAAEIDPLPQIEEGKSYPRGVWARHRGGLVRSTGTGGWDVMCNGIAQFSVSQSDIDPRLLNIIATTTDAKGFSAEIRIPFQIYRGIYKSEVAYEQGDTVTWDGSLWHCNANKASGSPGKSQDWQLMAKRGNNGKDGAAGKDGAPGPEGKPGRDLRFS